MNFHLLCFYCSLHLDKYQNIVFVANISTFATGIRDDDAADYISYLFDRHGIDIREPAIVELLEELVDYYYFLNQDRDRDRDDDRDRDGDRNRNYVIGQLSHHFDPNTPNDSPPSGLGPQSQSGPQSHSGPPDGYQYAPTPGYHTDYKCGPDGCRPVYKQEKAKHHLRDRDYDYKYDYDAPQPSIHRQRPSYGSDYYCDVNGCRPIDREHRRGKYDGRHKRRGYFRHHDAKNKGIRKSKYNADNDDFDDGYLVSLAQDKTTSTWNKDDNVEPSTEGPTSPPNTPTPLPTEFPTDDPTTNNVSI